MHKLDHGFPGRIRAASPLAAIHQAPYAKEKEETR
jgi:hypothetical protein